MGAGGRGYGPAMHDGQEYTVETAREAAGRDELAEWVSKFLASPGSDNADLADKLAAVPRWWLGPVELPMDQLNRLAGPPGQPVLREATEAEWRDDVDDLARQVEEGRDPPPVVVSYRNGQLILEDGNHRVEAIRRAGKRQVWAVVAFEDPAERDDFVARSAA